MIYLLCAIIYTYSLHTYHGPQATTLQTVADLKSNIQNREHIPIQEQLLVYNAESSTQRSEAHGSLPYAYIGYLNVKRYIHVCSYYSSISTHLELP